ncbi:hypothetical protein ACHAXR_012354 [Thalassiosira sp. AJA248-18]
MAEGQHHLPHPRGRPPSYPAVVTTTTTNTGNCAVIPSANTSSAAELSSSTPMTAPPPSSLEAAFRLYERDGNAVASLEACQRLWKKDNEAAGIGNEFENENDAGVLPLSRQHNQAVLEHLSSLRSQRRRVRRRPSSFDEGADTGNENGPKESSDNLAVILSSVLTVSDNAKSDSHQQPGSHIIEGNTANNDAPTNSEPHSIANQSGDTLFGKYNQLVGFYNVCLSNYAAGNHQEALDVILSPFLAAMKSIEIDSEGVKAVCEGDDADGRSGETNDGDAALDKKGDFSHIGYLVMTTRIAFLVFDCCFALNGGNGTGLGPIVAKGDNNATIAAEEILTWVEKYTLSLSTKGGDAIDHNLLEQYESMKYDELKFRLHLYRSRILFLGNKSGSNELEVRTRTSRKELKNAMDIYQNKLCVAEEGKEHGKKGKHPKQGGSKAGSGGNEVGSHQFQITPPKGKAHQDVSETTSVTSMAGGSLVTSVSDALWSEGKGGVGVTRATFEGMPNKMTNAVQQQQQQASQATDKVKKDTPDLQVRHESVLYLKANLEYLRGNTTKSLKLCSEARSAGKRSRANHDEKKDKIMRSDIECGEVNEKGFSHDTTEDGDKNGLDKSSARDGETQMACDYDEAIYYNNLALLHQSAGKVHLALHYYSYALSYIERVNLQDGNNSSCTNEQHPTSSPKCFWSDGVACPDISAEILHNTSICALQAQQFKKAYDCMARCVNISPNVFGVRARSWLRLAQSCIGIYTNLQQTSKSNDDSRGIGLDSNEDLGSQDDCISTTLQRASRSLYRALRLSSGNPETVAENFNSNDEVTIPSPKEGSMNVDMDCFETALVSLAYVKLQLKDPVGALEVCQHALRRDLNNVDKSNPSAMSLRLMELAETYSREATICDG